MSEEQDPFGNIVAPQSPPREYERITKAVVELRRAFASCGLESPTAIVLEPRQAARLEAIMSLSADRLAIGTGEQLAPGEVKVAGVLIQPRHFAFKA